MTGMNTHIAFLYLDGRLVFESICPSCVDVLGKPLMLACPQELTCKNLGMQLFKLV